MATHYYFCIFFVFFVSTSFAQIGFLTGTLTSKEDNLPLPGVNILIKGTTRGVQTDFDGKYRIACKVGDTVVISYVGMITKEVVITREMLASYDNDFSVPKITIKTIENEAYQNRINSLPKSALHVKSLDDTNRTYNRKNSNQFNRIKNIDTTSKHVRLTYFNPDIFYEIGFNTLTGIQSFQKGNLPEFQKIYAQGTTFGNDIVFSGPETGNIFSYAPKINNLEFDGNNYQYDRNGRLVPLGQGNGLRAKIYDNQILSSSIKNRNHLFFNVSTNKSLVGFSFTNTNFKDVFNREQSTSNEMEITFRTQKTGDGSLNWKVLAKYGNNHDNQPNINGFINNVLFSAWSTPLSFSNRQGISLENGVQRSFSPARFNNPNWLLSQNRNHEANDFFIASIQNKLNVSDKVELKSLLSFTHNNDVQNFGLRRFTVGFPEGYMSDKLVIQNRFNALLDFRFENDNYDHDIKITSLIDFSHEDLNYDLSEGVGINEFSFDSANQISRVTNDIQRNSLRLLNRFQYENRNSDFHISVANNSYINSLQENRLFLPNLQFKLDLDDLLDLYLGVFTISASTAFDVSESSLFYGNQSHNSLLLQPSQTNAFTANNDLFANDNFQLEENRNYEFGTNLEIYAFGNYLDFSFNYFDTKTSGSVFPIFENGHYSLQNVADIQNRGVEFSIDTRIQLGNRFYYEPKFVFSANRTKVLSLHNDDSRVPIAGFSTVSKNLIVGERAGIIVGSGFARDDDGNKIIGEDGFPIVATAPQIIGDPTADFNLGIYNNFNWKNFNLNIVLDIQSGGDVWNGTQGTLNYLGVSKQSAEQRNLTNFIFDGVNAQGQVNNVPVDFYSPQNGITQSRFVRDGFTGIDEEYIVDGSYFNFKTIELSYSFKKKYNKSQFVNEMVVGLYAHNLLNWTSFRGASPYRSLYDNASSQALNFFNVPITTEVGLTLNIKI